MKELTGKNLIGGSWKDGSGQQFYSVDPRNGEKHSIPFQGGSESDIDEAVTQSINAFRDPLFKNDQKRAELLELIASKLEEQAEEFHSVVISETGLPEGRIVGEKGRTVFQIRSFVEMLRTGKMLRKVDDPADPQRTPLPKPELVKRNIPLGPVAVFSAGNFPLAFSTIGGDSVSALASGCPVLLKGHEGHLRTNEWVAQIILEAINELGLPKGIFSFINGGYHIGKSLVQNPGIKAVAFTGSYTGGKALIDYARDRKEPIPVFCEMGSINPMVISKGYLEKEKVDEFASIIGGSIFLGTGQFCTNPGLIFLERSNSSNEFINALELWLSKQEATPMLNQKVFADFKESLSQLGIDHKDDENHSRGYLKNIKTKEFLGNEVHGKEVFGPYSLVVEYDNDEELKALIDSLEGQLTASLFFSERDHKEKEGIIQLLAEKVGRLIYQGVPTGVEVSPAMTHGGPWPASSDSRFTSVGSESVFRFLRPITYQGFPENLAPFQ